MNARIEHTPALTHTRYMLHNGAGRLHAAPACIALLPALQLQQAPSSLRRCGRPAMLISPVPSPPMLPKYAPRPQLNLTIVDRFAEPDA